MTANGNLALALENTKIGDLVAVLFGGSTPFMLSEIHQESDGANKQHRLLGDCYVHGCMDEELVEGAQTDEGEMLALK